MLSRLSVFFAFIGATSVGTCLTQDAMAQVYPQSEVISRVSHLQEDDEAEVREEIKKLKLRLRELEDDFVDRDQDYVNDSEQLQSFSESTTANLEDLSKTVKQLDETVQKIDGTIPNLVGHAGAGPKAQLFGRLHLGYYSYSDIDGLGGLIGNPADRLGFRRLRIGLQGDINDNMFYRIQTEFADPNDFQIRDAFFAFRDLSRFGTVIIGNQKRPYSLDQLNDSNYNVFLDRPYVADAFNDQNRRLGISSNGHSRDLKYNWRSGVYNMENIQDDGLFQGNNLQLEVASRIAATPWYDECSGGRGYLHVAASVAHRFPDGLGPNNLSEYSTNSEAFFGDIFATGPIVGAESESIWGFETVLNIGAFQLGAEYMETFVDRFEPSGPNLNFHGGYIYAAYMLTGEHMSWNRKQGVLGRIVPFENFFSIRDCNCNVQRGLGAWQIAARYSYIDLNDEDIFAGASDSLTLGLNWYWNPYSRVQLNYINADVDSAPFAEGTYDLFGLQFETFF